MLAALFGPRAIRFVTLPLQIAALLGIIAALALIRRLRGRHAGSTAPTPARA